MSQTASKSCEICAASRGEYLCLQCDQLFCARCKVSHLKAKISTNHVFLHGPNIDQEVKTRCEEHDELFIYQCFECNMPVCRVCFIKSHKGHNVADLTEYTDELKTNVRTKIVSTLESLNSNKALVGDGTLKYQQEIQTVIESITEDGIQQKQLIDKKVADLIQSVKGEETKQLQTLFQIQNDIQSAHDRITECQQLLDSLTIGDISKSINQVKSEVDMVIVPGLPVIPTVSYTPKVTTAEDIDQLFSNVHTTLSSIAGEQLNKGNPAITDLGDPNKIEEKYGELYDNEWAESMDFLTDIKVILPDLEREAHEYIIIHYLHRILLECFHDCKNESQIQMRALGFSMSEDNTDQDQKSKGQKGTFLKEGDFNLERRRNAESFSKYLCQEKMICKNMLANWDYPWKREKFLDKLIATPYFEKCVTLCWYMVIQDPMMYLDEPLAKDSPFDRGSYKEFVQKGDKVEFVVWPALYLHKGGPLLYKGVVQVYTPDKEIKDDN